MANKKETKKQREQRLQDKFMVKPGEIEIPYPPFKKSGGDSNVRK